MASTLQPPPPAPASAPAATSNPADSASSLTTAASSEADQTRARSQKTRSNSSKDKGQPQANATKEIKKDGTGNRNKKEKKADSATASANSADAQASSTAPATSKQPPAARRRGSRASKNANQPQSQPQPQPESQSEATHASPAISVPTSLNDPAVSPKRQPKSTGRNSTKKQQSKANESIAKDSLESSTDGAAAGALLTPSPRRGERLSTSTDGSSNHTNNSNSNNNNSVDGSSVRKKSKKKSKEPTIKDTVATADSNASEAGSAQGKRQKDKSSKDTATATTTGKAKAGNTSRSQGGRQSNKGGHQAGAGFSDVAGDKLKEKGSASSRDVRPSSISSSCSFVTSSSSLSPTSPTSSSSSSSSPTSPANPGSFGFNSVAVDNVTFAAGAGAAVAPATKDSPRDRSEVTRIRTNVAGDFSSSSSAPLSAGSFSPLSQTSPSSRRSSTLTPLGDKLGRLGGGLPTVEENISERHLGHGLEEAHPGGQPTPGGAAKRGHSRSLSMKEQLAALDQQKKSNEGKTLESLQEIISSLKNLPPTAAAVAGHTVQADHTLGTTRHEKRLSLSSLSGNRNSVGPLSGASSTTLHISQPPRGTTIESALQSTVATLRRLSVSDSKRPLVPLKEHESEAAASSIDRTGNRRSAVFARNAPSAAADSIDQRRISTSAGYQPNRRSVIVKPEEVAALQEGRPYVPSAFSFSSDDEPDAVADALSALEGKASTSNRSSYSAHTHHQPSTSSVDANSLAEFAARLPSHMKPVGAAALVNNDDAQDRRRFTTAFHSMSLGTNRTSVLAPGGAAGTLGKRLSTVPSSSSRETDRKDWRMSTPTAFNNRDSVSFKDSANGRRPLFMAHLTYSDFHSLLTKQKNKYVQGVLRINKRNRSDAYVTVDALPEGDVYICGSKDRNRALEGDVVGIELIEQEEQSQQRTDGQKDRKNNKNGENGEETAEPDVDEIKPKYCGRIVSIVERSISQMFSGTLTLQRPSGSTKKNERRKDDDEQKGQPRIVWFKPTDKRVPLIAIPIDQAPADFIDNHASYAHKLFVASIKRWPLSSLHPFGQLERELGDIGNIEIETEALLADNNVTTTAFGEKVEKCLPDLPWAIPEKELSRRRDLRQDCIFTIDPATAKDLDDAVSCTRLDDGTYEIGVHIADVSHFIKVGSALDREAKSRATTVYLVQKAIPMLPNVLCEDLCSLTANVDRLAFSVFWKMTEDGHVLATTFSKSVIRSCAQLSYDDAQRVITTGSLDPKVEVHGQPRTLVEENIKVFFKLSQILRQNRFENGSLSINSIKLSFATDEIHNPLDVSVYELKESNRLIEEFMLLANMSVAKQICEFFPEQALLRRHEEPLEKRMADFISHMNKIGLDLDASSSGALQQSLDAIQDPDVRKVVRLLVIKPMQRAKYICSGMLNPDKYHHYALNSPLYTHFTSPIRRYADIIVHRMLEASLVGDSKFYLSKESCQKSADHCNIKKDAAKLAQEQSSHVYLSVLLRNMTESKGRVVKDAIVVQVLDAAFDVLVPEYGLEKRVYVDQLPLERHSWNESTETLKLYWTTDTFKVATEDDGHQDAALDTKNRRLSALPGAHLELGAMDHPDDATNAYDDERGLFEDESDDDSGDGLDAHSTVTSVPEDEEEGDDEARRLSRIRIFGHVQVLITADTTISPPVIKMIAMNPFAAKDELDTSSAAVAV
ncbi:hypothetical protein BGZ70_009370 [Mortierella alpina]|uniref:DIS3-like exonuclease 2 n=1 Tax=Mortierella alpina TaxID=64518 RepID=A0A9P6J223_MORAP|nr:hypothetical protein BGZ70_009370 [Mortierella alpina]